MRDHLRRHGVKLAALAVILSFYGFARLPSLGDAERDRLAERFAFTRHELPQPPGERRTVRAVHPSLEHISAWISSVGAAVALADLDGDGLANDVCYVDTATDRVVVTEVPGTSTGAPARYELFTLEAAPLPYDAATTAPMGCLPGDLNEDGAMDVLVYYWGRTPVAFLQRAGGPPLAAGSFVPREVDPSGERWFTNAATRADVDGDGRIDLLIGNYFQDGARILDASGAGGRQQMQRSMSRAGNGGRNRLLLLGGGTGGAEPTVVFEDASDAVPPEVAHGWTLALGAADLTGDLLPEIYVGNDFGPDRLLHNRSRPGRAAFAVVDGRRGFADPRSKVLGHDSFKGMGVDFADLNGDGVFDIYVSNIAEEFALEESHFVWVSRGDPAAAAAAMADGRAPYADDSEGLGLSRSAWSWDTRFGDFDADGTPEALQATGFVRGEDDRWPELHEVAMGNDTLLEDPRAWHRVAPGDDLSGWFHNPFFVRSASGRYFDLAPYFDPAMGMAEPMVSRAIATADVDGDGDLDFAVGNQWQASYLFRNEAPGAGRSLVLALSRPGSGGGLVPAVGAQVRVRSADGRSWLAQVDGGNGHSGVRSPEVHVGVGAVGPGELLEVEITWRDGGGVHRERYRLAAGRHAIVLGRQAVRSAV